MNEFKLFKQIAAQDIALVKNGFRNELVFEAFLVENTRVLAYEELEPETLTYQLHIEHGREKKGTDGRIDILCKMSDDNLAIVEVKNDILIKENIEQLNDYLKAFGAQREKILKFLEKENKEDYSGLVETDLIGILVGTGISEELMKDIESGKAIENHQILAITVDRYSSEDKDENYYLVEYYGSKTNKSRFLRFENFSEFDEHQKAKGIPSDIAKLYNSIHEYLRVKYDVECKKVKYASDLFTFNVAKRKKRVFAYVIVRKKSIKMYLNFENQIPVGAKRDTNFERYPDSMFYVINNLEEFNNDVKDAIEKSYRYILNY